MNARALFSSLFAAVLVACIGSRPARAQTFTPINFPGAIETRVIGISGTSIVGNYTGADGGLAHGFLFNGSSYTLIEPPGSQFSSIGGISGSRIVGSFNSDDGVEDASFEHGFLYDGSSYTVIDHPDAIAGGLVGISGNNIIGGYLGSDGNQHGFLFDGSSFTTIDHPGSDNTHLIAISGNNIIGNGSSGLGENTTSHDFLYNGSSFTTIQYPDPPAGSTILTGISGNNIVGSYFDYVNLQSRGFIYDGSTYRPIDVPGDFNHTSPAAVSGSTVVGEYTDGSSGERHGFIYTGSTYLRVDVNGAYRTIVSGTDGTQFVGTVQHGLDDLFSGFVFQSIGLTQDNPVLPLDIALIPPNTILEPPSPDLPIPDDPGQLGTASWFKELCDEADPFHIHVVFELQPGQFACFPLVDPPMATGFLYQTANGAHFLAVGMPVGLGDFFTISDGINSPIALAAGSNYVFPTPVSSFTVTGIHPPVDGADPTAFPTRLALDQEGAYFAMTPINLPEPSTLLLAGSGVVTLGAVAWRRRRTRERRGRRDGGANF